MSGRKVLVTGASRGIGEAVARAFAERGDVVAVHHRDSAELAEKVRAGLPGEGHVIVSGDLTDPAAVRAFVDGAALSSAASTSSSTTRRSRSSTRSSPTTTRPGRRPGSTPCRPT
ncbi:SDR family NAD(P)-dependent oxidoreductase [Dactylosporangium cerinum]